MVIENIDLTIEGRSGDKVQVWYRGDRDRDPEEGDPAPIIYTGHFGSNGRVLVSVPRAYLVLGRPVRKGGTPLDLHDEVAPSKTVQLPPE